MASRGNLAAPAGGRAPSVQYVFLDCTRQECFLSQSYYDTRAYQRPRVFYGYEPHRQGDWFRYRYERERPVDKKVRVR